MHVVLRIAAVMLLFCLAQTPAGAADVLTGTWTMHARPQSTKVDLQLRSGDVRHGYDSSSDVESATLGVVVSDLQSPAAKVSFTLKRDAGTISGTGDAHRGFATGTFIFTPSAAFEDTLKRDGYRNSSNRELLAAAMLDITSAYAGDLRATGYTHMDFGRLLALRALNVDRALIESLASLGYDHISTEELLELSALRIDAAYVRRVEAHGIAHPSIEQLVKLKALDVVFSTQLEDAAS